MERSRKRITVASAKEKGRALQDKVASEIAALLGVPFSKEDDALVSSRPMGQHGTDIILRGKAREVFPFSVECKSTEQFSLADAWDQAVANKAGGQHPMVVYKHKNINEPVVIVGWGCFLNIFSYVLFSGRSKDEQEESSKS
jgi:hypothetical protein